MHAMRLKKVFSKTYCKPSHHWPKPITNINKRCYRFGRPKRILKERLARILERRTVAAVYDRRPYAGVMKNGSRIAHIHDDKSITGPTRCANQQNQRERQIALCRNRACRGSTAGRRDALQHYGQLEFMDKQWRDSGDG